MIYEEKVDSKNSAYQEVKVETEMNELPKGSVKATDPDSGLTYYIHEEDNITTWDKPIVDSNEVIDPSTSEVVLTNEHLGSNDNALIDDVPLLIESSQSTRKVNILPL